VENGVEIQVKPAVARVMIIPINFFQKKPRKVAQKGRRKKKTANIIKPD